MANLQTQQIRGGHSLIGIGAALVGVALGIGVVYVDGYGDGELAVHAQGGGSCKQQEDACRSANPYSVCHAKWVQCVTQKCSIGGTGAGQCSQDPDCQNSCTEESTSTGGKISCCSGAPIHDNPCKDKVDGKCNPKPTELGGKEMPMMPMMGGMPPMLPMLPMPMPKPDMPMPMPAGDECTKEPKPAHCDSGTSKGLLDSFKDMFSPSSQTAEGESKPSVLSKLTSFITGGSSDPTTPVPSTIHNPTEAVVTPITPSGSNAGQVTSSGVQASGNTNTQTNTSGPNSTVTGFGSGAQADVNTQTGPVLAAIRSVTARIQSLLSSIF